MGMGAAQTARARVPHHFHRNAKKERGCKDFHKKGTQCAAFLQVKLSTIFILNWCVVDEGEAALTRTGEKAS